MEAKPLDAWRTQPLVNVWADLTLSYPTLDSTPSSPLAYILHSLTPITSCLILSQGFVPTCAYIFQPDMLVMRVVEVSILQPDVPLPQTLLSYPSYLK